MAAVGDVFFGRLTKPDFYHKTPFSAVKDIWKDHDLVFCNLETPVTKSIYRGQRSPYRYRKLTFRARPKAVSILKNAGFNLVSLANNHAWDQGARGLRETMEFLESGSLPFIGAGPNPKEACSVRVMNMKGIRVGFMAVTNVLNFPVPAKTPAVCYMDYRSLVRRLPSIIAAEKKRLGLDFFILSLHYGTEYHRSIDPSEITFGRRLRAHGADVIIGHHPHVLRPVDYDGRGVIFWSLGNFHFDTAWGWRGLSAVADFSLVKDSKGPHLANIHLIPVVLQYAPRGMPRRANRNVGWAIYHMLRERSRRLRTRLVWNSRASLIDVLTKKRRTSRIDVLTKKRRTSRR